MYHHKQKPALLKRGHPFYVLQIKCLGLWSSDDRRWNDKVGPWDIPLSKGSVFLKMRRYSRRPKRERRYVSGDNASTQKIAPPPPPTHTHTHTQTRPYQSSETRAFVFVPTPICSTVSMKTGTPVTSSLLLIFHFQAPPWFSLLPVQKQTKKKKKVGRTTKKVSSRTRARGSVCQTQAFTVFRLFCRGTTLTSSSLFYII